MAQVRFSLNSLDKFYVLLLSLSGSGLAFVCIEQRRREIRKGRQVPPWALGSQGGQDPIRTWSAIRCSQRVGPGKTETEEACPEPGLAQRE